MFLSHLLSLSFALGGSGTELCNLATEDTVRVHICCKWAESHGVYIFKIPFPLHVDSSIIYGVNNFKYNDHLQEVYENWISKCSLFAPKDWASPFWQYWILHVFPTLPQAISCLLALPHAQTGMSQVYPASFLQNGIHRDLFQEAAFEHPLLPALGRAPPLCPHSC